MRTVLTVLIPALFFALLAPPSSKAQEKAVGSPAAGESKAGESLAGGPNAEAPQKDYRKRTRFRILDRAGKAWVGARLVAYSRPCAGIMDRVEGVSGKRGRASLQLLPGRVYAAWAWSPVENSSVGEYRITKLETRAGAGGIIRLHETHRTNIQLRIEFEGLDRWKAPYTAKIVGNMNTLERRYYELDVPLENKQLTLPPCPASRVQVYLLDAENHLIGQASIVLSRASMESALKSADERRSKLKEADAAKDKGDAEKRMKEDAPQAEESRGAAEKVQKVEVKQDQAKGEAKGKAKGEAKGKAKGEAKGKTKGKAKGKAKRKAVQFQVVQLGPLVKGVQVVAGRGMVRPNPDFLELGRARWDLPSPYYVRVKLEDKKTKAPIAHARIFQTVSSLTYEMGRSDENGMATLTMAMPLDKKSQRPTANIVSFRVHALGYPETYVQRYGLKLERFREKAEVDSKDSKPLFVSSLTKGFAIKGRIMLSEGKPLAGALLLIGTGMVYDYGNRNMGFNQSAGPLGTIRTDAEGRFEWPSCEDRFVVSISTILEPQVLAGLFGDRPFPSSARVLMYQAKGATMKAAEKPAGKAAEKAAEKAEPSKKPAKPELPEIRDLGDLRLDTLSEVMVQVTEADGMPMAHARVGLISRKAGQNYWSPPIHLCNHLGRLRVFVPPGKDYILGAGVEGRALLRTLSLPMRKPIALRVESGLALQGRAVDPNGDPLEGVRVYLYPFGGRKTLHQGLWNALRGGNQAAMTQDDGTFAVPVRSEMTYRFHLNYLLGGKWYSSTQQRIEIESSGLDLGDIEIPVPVQQKTEKKLPGKTVTSRPSK